MGSVVTLRVQTLSHSATSRARLGMGVMIVESLIIPFSCREATSTSSTVVRSFILNLTVALIGFLIAVVFSFVFIT